jgi:hypothetical protein
MSASWDDEAYDRDDPKHPGWVDVQLAKLVIREANDDPGHKIH